MWAWLATLVTVVGAVIVAYALARLFKLSDAAIDREITDVSVVVITQIASWSSRPIVWVATSSLSLTRLILSRPKRLLLMIIVTGMAIALHYEHQKLAPVIDRFWRCSIGKAFDDFLVPLIQVWRLLYALVVPIVNFYGAIVAQIIRGTPIILAKCQISELLAPVSHTADALKEFFYALGHLFGIGAPISQTNNIAVNEFEIEPAARSGLLAIAALKSGVNCACASLEDITNILFRVIESPNAAKAVDHSVGVIVRLVQMLLRIVIPPHEAPKPERILYHLYGAWITSALALDDAIAAVIENIIRIFAPKTVVSAPKEFLFTALARWGTGEAQRLNALFGLGPWSVTVPDEWSDSTAMMARWRPDEAYSNMYIASYDAGVVVQWVVYLAENLIAGLASEGKALTPQPHALDCDWGRDINNQVSWPKGVHFLSYTAGCATYYAGLSWFGWQHVLHSYIVEIFFTTIVRQEQSFLRLTQKYDGMWASRRNPSTCEKRKEAATPVGHVSLDWSVNPNQCRCDMHLGTYHAPDPNHRTYDSVELSNYQAYEAYENAYSELYNVSIPQASLTGLESLYSALSDADQALVSWLHAPSTANLTAWKNLQHVQREKWEMYFAGSTRTPPDLTNWDVWGRLSRHAREALARGLAFKRTPPPPNGDDAVYNPWCGQPTMQAQIFDPLDGLLVHVLHGIFGPTGIGELLSEVQPTTVPPFGAAAAFVGGGMLPGLPVMIPPYTRIYLEGARVATRVLFSLPDIFDLRWAFYDINCGYGLNETHLINRWNTYYRGESIAWREGDELYVEETGLVQLIQGDELRWRICEERGYKIPKVTDGRSFDFDSRSQLCADNSQAGCMCNYNVRLERDAPCQCIAHYPEEASLTSPVVEVEVRERFTSDAVSSRWCNKLAAEWFFYHVSVVIDSLVWITQFGPIYQEECGIASLAGKASLFDDDRKKRIAASWVEIPTSESFFDASTLYYNVLSGDVSDSLEGTISTSYQDSVTQLMGSSTAIASLAEYTALVDKLTQTDAYEGPGPYVNVDADADPPAGTSVFTITDSDVSMGGGDFDPAGSNIYQTALSCVQEKDAEASRLGTVPDLSACTEISQGASASTGTCKIYGNTEFPCASSAVLRISATGLLYALRRVTEGTFGVFGGDIFGVNLNPTTFLCLYSKFIGSYSSLLPSVIFMIPKDYKQAFTKLIFGVQALFVLTPVKVATSTAWFMYKNLAKAAELLLQGKSLGTLGNEVKQGVNEAVVTIIRLLFDGAIVFVNSLGDFFDLWGAGQFFRTVSNIINIVRDAFTGVFLDILGLWMELIARMFAVLSGKSSITEFIEIFFKVIIGLFDVILKQAGRLLSFLLKLLGPVGDFIKKFATGTCHVLNDIICGLTAFGGLFGGGGCQRPLQCVNLRASHTRLSSIVNITTRRGLSATHYVNQHLVWNGTSLCDHFMDALEKSYDELTALERAQWYECLEMRAIGLEMQAFLAIPDMYMEDIFYNWRRKWQILQGLGWMSSAAFNLWWTTGQITEHALKVALIDAGVNPRPYVHIFTKIRTSVRAVSQEFTWMGISQRVFNEADSSYKDPLSTSIAARLYRISNAAGVAWDGSSRAWHNQHASRAFHKLAATSPHLSKTSLLHVPHVIRTGGTTAWTRLQAKMKPPTRRILRAPIRTNITLVPPTYLCPGNNFCFECALLDNFIDQVVVHATEVGDFYGTVFGAEEQRSKRACLTTPCRGISSDVIHYFNMYFKNASDSVLDTISGLGAVYDATVRADRVPRWNRVSDDWQRLFTLDVSVEEAIDAFTRFVETANDTYVPFTGFGLPYVVTYPIAETCKEEAIFVKHSTQEERLRRIDSAVVGVLFAFLIIFTSGTWSFIPFGDLIGSALALQTAFWVFLWVVYGWLPTCFPTLPYLLMEDVSMWIQTRMDPGCFCTLFPELTTSFCKASSCDVCFVEKVATYENCLDTHPIMTEWSIFWNGPFFVRWQFPSFFSVFVQYTDVFDDSNTTLAMLAREAYELPNTPDPHMLDCFWMTALNLPINMFVWGYAAYVASTAAVQIALFIGNGLLTFFTVFMLFGRMVLSIES